ncbi:MAG: hypothetical protein QG628_425, partial [Patescibacteria group bacterium]|nr:hypothetical protein [Patescibacteria group bacterium]
GEPVLGTVVSETVRPGSRVVVRVLDDDTSSDVIWNSILKTRINWRIDAEVQSTGTKFVSLRANANGEFTLLDRNVTIDAPDLIATTDFIVPETQDGLWVTETQLIDSSRKNIGKLLFSSLWSAPQELTKQQKEIEQQQEKVSTSFGKYIFWGVIGIFLLVWFGWSVISNLKTNSPSDKNT